MRKRILLTGALGVLITVAVVTGATADGEAPVILRSGNLILAVKGNASPKRLPKTGLAPISFHTSGSISTTDGTHPPALEEVIVDVGKAGAIEADKFPVCKENVLTASSTEQAERACRDAIVGGGRVGVEVEFPESKPFTTTGKAVIFNGGQRGGKSLVFIHTYVSVPAPTAVVTPIATTKEHKGPYRLHSVAKIPTIAGGAGSITSFYLKIDRKNYLKANCDNGHFSAHVRALFRGGPTLSGSFIRPCIGIG